MFNEEKNAEKCVVEVMKVLTHLRPSTNLLIVNDGSTDNTGSVLSQMKKKYTNLTVVINKSNGGYGAALQTGIKKALELRFTYGLFMDSDLTNDPIFIKNFVTQLKRGVDCVKASRYIKGGGMINVPYYRQFISIVGNMIARSLFGINVNDCSNGFRMVRLSLLKNIIFKQQNFSIIMEELYYLKKKGATFMEIPNVLTARKNTLSKFRYYPSIFWDYLKYPLMAFFVKYNPK